MGWYNGGSWENLSSRHLVYIIRDLMRAVNQRREALAFSPMSFIYSTDGDTEEYPTIEQLNKLPIEGEEMKTNLQRLKSGTTQISDYFVDWTGTSGPWWNVEDPADQIEKFNFVSDYGALIDDPQWLKNPEWAIRLKNWLSDMRYALIEPSKTNTAGTLMYQSEFPGSIEYAWDHRRDLSAAQTGLWVFWDVGGSPNYMSQIKPSGGATYHVEQYSGDIVGDCFMLNVYGQEYHFGFTTATSAVFDVEFAGNTYGDGYHAVSGVITDLDADVMLSLEITTSEPSDSPFPEGGGVFGGRSDADVLIAELIIDLQPVCDDLQ